MDAHLLILGQARHPEERLFYILAAIKGKWSSRKLERQIRTGTALRVDAGRKKVSAVMTQLRPKVIEEFMDSPPPAAGASPGTRSR